MKKFIGTLAALLWALLATGQTFTVSGIVTSLENGEPLPGTNIYLKNSQKGTVSDAEGRYLLQGIEKGQYTLVYSFVGFKRVEKSIEVEGNMQLDASLEISTRSGDEVIVYAQRTYPITKSSLEKKDIEKQNLGQDFPFLLNFTPSIVSTSDAGAGIGYTSMRIRGSDAQRVNVTINGVPLNDSESHGVFWVNMPDFASTVEEVTIQRGVGTSVNGAGAFGGSVNIRTQMPEEQAFVEINNSYGSFDTWRNNVVFNTGKINDHFSFIGRLSKLTSDGFIDNAFVDMKSFYLSGKYEGEIGAITANVFSGQQTTFQAWYGVPESVLEEGNRTFNSVAGYDNETDNYQQDHYQLLYDKKLGRNWEWHMALHYTHGEGYYEQFQGGDNPFAERSFSLYGLENVVVGGETITETDLIRRRWLDNDFYGGIWSLRHFSSNKKWEFVWGGGYSRYEGGRFGEIIWAEFAGDSFIRDRYYDNASYKDDFNTFLKATYQCLPNLYLFADAQVRNVDFFSGGFESLALNESEAQDNFLFFNPKAGASYLKNDLEIYASFSIGSKEPTLLDYYAPDVLAGNATLEAEYLRNLEAGFKKQFGNLQVGANYYLMDYRNQLIATGQLNDVGFSVRTNVPDSYRTGLEMQAEWQPVSQLSWSGNATLSRNKIREYTEFLDDFDNGGDVPLTYTETDIAFSPELIAASQLSYRPFEGFEVGLLSKYVGEQYLDNTESDARKLDAYMTQDLRLTYQFSAGPFSRIEANMLINNLLDAEYESNGYTFGYFFGGEEVRENYYYPQAGRNFLFSLKLRI